MKRENNIQEELHEISSVVANIPFVNVYTCPTDYFDHLSKEVSLLINSFDDNEAELKNLKDVNTYQTPPGYFDNFSKNVIHAIQNDGNANRANIHKLNWVKIAFAACFISMLGLYLYKISSIKEADTLDPYTATLIKEAKIIINQDSFEDEMNKVDEMDLVKYLQEGGQDVDAALIASLEDESQLNDREIYLFDGETLDQYMKELNIQHANHNNN